MVPNLGPFRVSIDHTSAALAAGEAPVGQLTLPVTLRNYSDVVLARLGHRDPAQIRTYTGDALIDTGALYPVLPPAIAEQLGLRRLEPTDLLMADGRLVVGDKTEPLVYEIAGRQTVVSALVLGSTLLVGALVLEALDLAVDTARGQLMPNLGTWDHPVFRV